MKSDCNSSEKVLRLEKSDPTFNMTSDKCPKPSGQSYPFQQYLPGNLLTKQSTMTCMIDRFQEHKKDIGNIPF